MTLSPITRRWLAAGLVLIVLLLAAGPIMRSPIAGRVRAAAAARGLDASWGSLHVSPTLQCRFTDLVLTRRADGDTVFRAASLVVSLDPLSRLMGRSGVSQIALAHARARFSPPSGAGADTLEPAPGRKAGDPQRAERLRSAARSLVRLLAAPARQMPRLSLDDVTLTAASRDDDDRDPDAAPVGVRIRWLELAPARGGIRFAASGALLGEREVPVEAALTYGHDDRIAGGARFDIPGEGRAPERLRITVDGALTQERRAGRVAIADTTRLTIGRLRFRLGGALERQGPRFRLALEADSLTAAQWQASLPAAVLGPLRNITVRGWYAYQVSLDLDLSQPDSVQFTADVVPHGLQIDATRTTLNLLALDEPFVAHIHLPHARIVDRELSPANPHFRPLGAIDTLLAHAVVTNEDGAFFRHHGFNTDAVKGSIADNVKAGAFRRGAGTITMQLVRNLYLGHARTLSRKGQEVVLAWMIEHLTPITKERMLEIYLNIIEWGPDIHGADEAAQFYFGHDAGRLTPDEALFLATVVPAPIRWRYRFDERGDLRPFEREQMHFIGRAMVAKGWLAPELLPAADALHVDLRGPARDILLPPAPARRDTIPA